VGVCIYEVCNVWMCVRVGFDNCVGVLVICLIVFTVFCNVSFMYIYFYLLLL
jgi:hypothetical protein